MTATHTVKFFEYHLSIIIENYKNCIIHRYKAFNNGNVPLKNWCCTNADCDNTFEWGECPEKGDLPDSTKCPSGYTSVDNGVNCYRVYWEASTRLSWSDAKAFCEKTPNTTLASILDPFEQGYVYLLAMAKTKADAWIGLTRDSASSPWGWTDTRPDTFTNWGQIASFNDTSMCVFIQATDGKWSMAPCSETRRFVCKYSSEPVPPPVVKPPPGYCDAGWKERGIKCYNSPLNMIRSYPEAKFDCIRQG